MKRNLETSQIISTQQWSQLPATEQEKYETVYRVSEKTSKILDTTDKVAGIAVPVVMTLGDVLFPGLAGIAGILGTGLALYKKWKIPLTRGQSSLEFIRNGAIATYEAIEAFKLRFPDTWKSGLKLELKKSEDEMKSENRPVVMPDELNDDL